MHEGGARWLWFRFKVERALGRKACQQTSTQDTNTTFIYTLLSVKSTNNSVTSATSDSSATAVTGTSNQELSKPQQRTSKIPIPRNDHDTTVGVGIGEGAVVALSGTFGLAI